MGFFSSLFFSSNYEEEQQQKIDRKNFDILKYDGIRALRTGKLEYASKCFAEALKIQEDYETTKHLISVCYMLGKHEQALEILNRMVEADTKAATLLSRANLLYAMELFSESAADCIQAIELEPDNYVAHFMLAKSERAQGEYAKAIDNIDKAAGINDRFADAFALRAEINLSIKNGRDALADVEKLIALAPDDETAYLLRGRICESLGDADTAKRNYQYAAELNPFNQDAYLLAGNLLMTQGKYDEAIPLFDEAIEHNETFSEAYAARSIAKRQTGDIEGAAEDEEKAREQNPDENQNDAGNNLEEMSKGSII